MLRRPVVWTLALFLLAFAQSGRSESQPHYRESWLKINQYSPVDAFSSQGSYGWRVGLGMGRLQQALAPNEETGPNSETLPPEMPRLLLNKGTPWPLDFGLQFARSLDESASWQFGGHLQWTLWEAFRMPSLAIRLSRIETLGLQALESVRTDAFWLGTSYGIFSYFTASLGFGRQWESWEWLRDEESLALAATDISERSSQRYVYSIGLKIELPHPLIHLSFEQVRWEDRETVLNLAKFGVVL